MTTNNIKHIIAKQMDQYQTALNEAFKKQDAYLIDFLRIQLRTLQILWDEIKKGESK